VPTAHPAQSCLLSASNFSRAGALAKYFIKAARGWPASAASPRWWRGGTGLESWSLEAGTRSTCCVLGTVPRCELVTLGEVLEGVFSVLGTGARVG
jgi:hypothetical protein